MAAEGTGTGPRPRVKSSTFPFCIQLYNESSWPLSSHPLCRSSLSTGNCVGTCICLRQIEEAMTLVNEHGAHSNWTD